MARHPEGSSDTAPLSPQDVAQYTRSLIETSPDPLVTISPEGKITNVNEKAVQVTGVARENLIGTDFSDYCTDPAQARSAFQKVFTEGAVTNYPLTIRHRDGHLTEILYNASLYRDAAGQTKGVFAAARDVTERNRALREVEELSLRNRLILDAAGEGIYGLDTEGRCTFVNPAAAQLLGFTVEEILGQKTHDLFHHTRSDGSPYPEEECPVQEAYVQGMVHRGNDVYWRKDGSSFEVGFVSTPIQEAGHTAGAVVLFRDITELRQTEKELRRSEKMLKEAQRIGRLGSWYADLATGEVYWSQVLYEMYGFDPALPPPLLNDSQQLFTPQSWDLLSSSIAHTIETGIPYEIELEMINREGGHGWMQARGELVRDAGGNPVRVQGVVMDITERKRAEEELRKLNTDFVTLLENTGDFIYFKDQNSRFIFCSQTLADITGHHDWRDMIGKHDLEVFPPETAQIYYEEELPIFRDGTPLLNKTDPYIDAQGRKRWVNTNKWPVFGTDGQTVIGIFGISRDITELKRAEDQIKELNRDLEQRVAARTQELQEANAELEAFAYSVSHDLRVPLRAIDGFSRIVLEEYETKLDSEGQRLLNIVRNNTQRMAQLIDDILGFSRTGRQEMHTAEIDMTALARDTLNDLSPTMAGRNIEVEIQSLPPAVADRTLMERVFVNLLTNAIKFTGPITQARIVVGAIPGEGETTYYVKDNGVGFDMRYADKLFGVFQRLHSVEEFEGTGIGLAIIKRVITRHGGRVWAQAEVGEGATIYFTLPNGEAGHE